jgi:hypothetical protein
MSKLFNVFVAMMLVLSTIFLVGFNIFSLINKTNHTGIDTYILVKIFLIIILFTLIVFIFSKFYKFNVKSKFLLVVLAICFLGILNVIIYEKLNIMMNYELWLKKGMPNKFMY